MLKANTEELLKSLEAFREKNKEKMQAMVRSFAMATFEIASSNTPMGDSNTFWHLYQKRTTDPTWQSYGLQPVEGFARGSWRVSLDGSAQVQELYGRSVLDVALPKANAALRNYNLGETVLISNYGPYIRDLNRNSSRQTEGQGIVAPTIDSVMKIASMSLKNYYDKGAV